MRRERDLLDRMYPNAQIRADRLDALYRREIEAMRPSAKVIPLELARHRLRGAPLR